MADSTWRDRRRQRPGWRLPIVALALLAGCRERPAPVAELEIAPAEIRVGYPECRQVELDWKVLSLLPEIDGRPLVFVHILDGSGEVLRTFDHPFPGLWRPGRAARYSVDIFQSALAPPLPPGRYALSFGLYDRAGHRWPLRAAGSEVGRQEYALGELVVAEPGRTEVPRFRFSPEWLPVESGPNRQMLARRWLAGDGMIRVEDIPSPGTVEMVLYIPEPDPETQRLELAAGEDHPRLVVSSTCDGVEFQISGVGRETLSLPVGSAGGEVPEDGCGISLQANYRLVHSGSLRQVTVSLEGLSWVGAAGPETGP